MTNDAPSLRLPLLQIDIISQTKNARAVQPHLQKCFDGIQSLEFGEGTTIVDIHAMVSGQHCAAELRWSTTGPVGCQSLFIASSPVSLLAAHPWESEDGRTQCGSLTRSVAGYMI